MATNELERLREEWWELEAARGEKVQLLELEKLKVTREWVDDCVVTNLAAELIPIRRKQDALLLRIGDIERDANLTKQVEATGIAFENAFARLREDVKGKCEMLMQRLEDAERRLAALERASGGEE